MADVRIEEMKDISSSCYSINLSADDQSLTVKGSSMNEEEKMEIMVLVAEMKKVKSLPKLETETITDIFCKRGRDRRIKMKGRIIQHNFVNKE